jgi:regulator of cell morphogenesis and NO signaling
MPTETMKTVAQIAVEHPAAAREFEKLGIDYCCGGSRTLEEACTTAGVSLDEVAKRLEALSTAPTEQNFAELSLSDLIEHITSTHHVFVREECPRIQQLAAKVVAKHGETHPELREVQSVFGALAAELSLHLMKEEQILFPYIQRLEEARLAGEPAPPAMFGTAANPIAMMEREHDDAGEALRMLRKVTGNYSAHADACTSFHALYQALQGFEADLHQHIHLENNVLFPGVLAKEAQK